MLSIRRAFAIAVAAVLIVGVIGGACDAAKTKARARAYVRPAPVYGTSGLTKVYVPAYMIKGSLVTGGRAFYKTSVPENALAGIRLGRPANSILARWGNPSRITVGTAEADMASAPGPQMPSGPTYVPPGGGGYPPDMTRGLNRAADMLGMQRSPLPPLRGYEAPGMLGMPGQQGQPGQPGGPPGGSESRTLRQEEVTWTYDLQGGITLEFIITDGTITQITVGGEGPWSLSKTRTGLQLGDSYKLVLWVMGFPSEPQKYVGRFLRVSYIDKNRTLYTFLNKKLVGVTVALVQQELQEGAGAQP